MDNLAELTIDQIQEVIRFMCGGGGYGDINTFLTKSISDMTEGNTTFLSTAYGAFKSVAIALLILYFLIEIFDLLMNSKFTLESFVKSLIKLLLSYLVITNGLEIIAGVLAFVGGATGIVNLTAELEEDNLREGIRMINTYLTNASKFSLIGAVIRSIIPIISMFITRILLYFIAIGRTIELLARAAMAPIALSNMFSEGNRNAGILYLRKLAAVGLQGMAIVVIMWAGSYAMNVYYGMPTAKDFDSTNPIYMDEDGTIHSMLDSMDVIDAMPYSSDLFDLPSATTLSLMEEPAPLTAWATAILKLQEDNGFVGFLSKIWKNIKLAMDGDDFETVTLPSYVGEILYANLFGFNNVIIFVLVQFACTGAAMKSQAIANDIMGVS